MEMMKNDEKRLIQSHGGMSSRCYKSIDTKTSDRIGSL